MKKNYFVRPDALKEELIEKSEEKKKMVIPQVVSSVENKVNPLMKQESNIALQFFG